MTVIAYARHMVTQYSMSDKLDLVTFEEPRQAFLQVGGSAAREYSEATARRSTARSPGSWTPPIGVCGRR